MHDLDRLVRAIFNKKRYNTLVKPTLLQEHMVSLGGLLGALHLSRFNHKSSSFSLARRYKNIVFLGLLSLALQKPWFS